MRISDWSSDVCSSDLAGMGVPLNMAILPVFAFGSFMGSVQLEQWLQLGAVKPVGLVAEYGPLNAFLLTLAGLAVFAAATMVWSEIGRASCREGVCQYV